MTDEYFKTLMRSSAQNCMNVFGTRFDFYHREAKHSYFKSNLNHKEYHTAGAYRWEFCGYAVEVMSCFGGTDHMPNLHVTIKNKCSLSLAECLQDYIQKGFKV